MGRRLRPATPRLLPWLLAPRRGPGLQELPRRVRGSGLDCLLLQPPAELPAASWPSGDPGPQPGAPHRCPRAPRRGTPGVREVPAAQPASLPVKVSPFPQAVTRSEAQGQFREGRQALFPRPLAPVTSET